MQGDRLRRARRDAGWTQGELASRAGVSRQLVGAVEAGRHLPRVDAALALASALGVEVGALFGGRPPVVDVVSGRAPIDGSPVRVGLVGDRVVTAPARVGSDGWDVADGVVEGGEVAMLVASRPGVVLAGCEPGLETLEHLLRQGGALAVTVSTSSTQAIEALAGGRAHAAVVHGSVGALPSPPPMALARFRLTAWRVGLAVPPGLGSAWWQTVVAGELPVVQREPGAMVQRTFEEAVGVWVPGPVVGGHVPAARHAMSTGLPGLTIEPAAVAVGAGFHPLGRHEAQLWIDERWLVERAVEEALAAIGSSAFRRRLEAVGGYDLEGIGSRAA
jgi:DNA-binding XRE family transcriptional regulator